MTPEFYFDSKKLIALARTHRKAYAGAQPYPHIVMDNFLPKDVANRILEEFPKPGQIAWTTFNTGVEKKLMVTADERFGPFTRHVMAQFNSAAMMHFLEELTGIKGLIPDPHFVGGGLHQIERGGHLGIHADFNRHTKLKLDRRLNLLLYLNKDWDESYGGHFEMWTPDMKIRAKRVLPVFNRCVVFSTTDFSFHGHPDPLTCPPGRTRKSLALYYYSNGRPASELTKQHRTLFQARPGETVKLPLLERLLPPIVLEAGKYVKDRLR
ncbi:MAG TPA: 2OG-Fe(II) oxygenase [Candidatus Binatia bacterium]|nr:2OG-Fe(II) oxygenase [Candidatus Binatia bacterium]